jgi:hypothetical protein
MCQYIHNQLLPVPSGDGGETRGRKERRTRVENERRGGGDETMRGERRGGERRGETRGYGEGDKRESRLVRGEEVGEGEEWRVEEGRPSLR